MAVVLEAALDHLGRRDLEEPVSRATLVRRLAAAMLMTARIAIFVIDVA